MPGVKGQRSGGRNKKAASAHILHGTFRSDRHAGDATPEPPAGRPTPPKRLSADARAEWKRMIVRLERAQTLTVVDDAALYQYVELFSETERVKTDHARLRKLSEELTVLARELRGHELLEAIQKVVSIEHILAKQTLQLRQGHMAIRQYLVEFGMTPAARTRVKTTGDATPKADPLAALRRLAGGA